MSILEMPQQSRYWSKPDNPDNEVRQRVLHVGGTHPNEPTGLRHFKEFDESPYPLPFDTTWGNGLAAGLEDAEEYDICYDKPDPAHPQRYIHQEMTSTSPGDLQSDCADSRRMWRLNNLYFPFYDVVVDEHNNFNESNYAVIGPEPLPIVMSALTVLGLRKVVMCNTSPYYRLNPHVLLAEVDYSAHNAMHDTTWWYNALRRLAVDELPAAKPEDFEYYRKIDPARVACAFQDGMTVASTPSFVDIPSDAKHKLGIDPDTKAIGLDWHRHFGTTPGGPGTIAVRCTAPDTWLQTVRPLSDPPLVYRDNYCYVRYYGA